MVLVHKLLKHFTTNSFNNFLAKLFDRPLTIAGIGNDLFWNLNSLQTALKDIWKAIGIQGVCVLHLKIHIPIDTRPCFHSNILSIHSPAFTCTN